MKRIEVYSHIKGRVIQVYQPGNWGPVSLCQFVDGYLSWPTTGNGMDRRIARMVFWKGLRRAVLDMDTWRKAGIVGVCAEDRVLMGKFGEEYILHYHKEGEHDTLDHRTDVTDLWGAIKKKWGEE